MKCKNFLCRYHRNIGTKDNNCARDYHIKKCEHRKTFNRILKAQYGQIPFNHPPFQVGMKFLEEYKKGK